ncbi:MAG TPA: DUF2254 domain-containing protein [Casimicrobiaceae bacterium]|nr:DUF2254 domain-containing protein [Casimicrobiaceae bacterium]
MRFRRAERYIKRKLAWGRFYRTASYLKSSLWIVPFVAIVLVLAMAPLLRGLDRWLGWRFVGLELSGAQALYQTVITLTLSFMVFTFGNLLVAIQVASGQLTPRIIATALLRDNVVRYSVGLFVFTLIFAVSALNRLDRNVPELVALVTVLLGIGCMATFLFLIDYAARLLRPVSICARIGNDGLAVIEVVYPERKADAAQDEPGSRARLGNAARIVTHSGNSEIVLAVDLETLVAEAERHDGIVEFIPQVGDFVAYEEPLFALYGGAASIDDRKLRAAVAFGSERTLEQDPMFAFRILVDIGLKALSPAINDPTTGVLAIDQVHRLLRAIGKRQLQCDDITDDQGRVRVVFRTPNWEDYLNVGCNEIRTCGAANIQIARRLRAMLDNLAASLPEHRLAALNAERARLDRAIESLYPIPDDLALARMPDSQGLGGSWGQRREHRG